MGSRRTSSSCSHQQGRAAAARTNTRTSSAVGHRLALASAWRQDCLAGWAAVAGATRQLVQAPSERALRPACRLQSAALTLWAKKQMGRSQLGPWLQRDVLKRSGCSQNSTAGQTIQQSAHPASCSAAAHEHHSKQACAACQLPVGLARRNQASDPSAIGNRRPVPVLPLTWVVSKGALLPPRTGRLQHKRGRCSSCYWTRAAQARQMTGLCRAWCVGRLSLCVLRPQRAR